MQIGKLGKILAAGSVGMLLAGSTVFAALDSYPAPFVSGSSFDSLIVVGTAAAPSDVVGAIDLATRLGGETTSLVSVTGASGTISITGEGRKVATGTTPVLLLDTLGKAGLRTTMTKDDLPTVLADGTFTDSGESTTQKYTQYIKMTPAPTADVINQLEFNLPGSSSSADPDYNFGRFSTSPTVTSYFYATQAIFDKGMNSTTSVSGGEKITLFGNEYTITSGTDFTQSTVTNNKLVLSGGADTRVLKGAETVTITINGVSYDVTFVGATSTTIGVVEVKTGSTSDQKSITKGSTVKINGLDVFLSDVYYLSTTDQTQNSGKVVIGSSKLTLQHGSKVKIGTNDDSVDGTMVNLTTSSGKLSTLTVYNGAHSSTDDFLKRGGEYKDGVWKSFKIAFPDVTPGLTDAARNTLKLSPSGDNLMQMAWTDDRGNAKTINFAYKASSTSQGFKLADNGGNNIIVLENQTMTRDQYFVEDAGDFTHLFRITGMSIDGTSTSNIELTDQFTGTALKVSFGADNYDAKVIDGQTVNIDGSGASAAEIRATWGAGAGNTSVGTYYTVFPVLKGKSNEHIAFTQPTVINLNFSAQVGKIQLPTGAITVTRDAGTHFNITASSNEDGTSSAIGTVAGNSSTTSGSVTRFNASASGTEVSFALGRTSTGGLIYNLRTVGVDTGNVNLTVGAAAAGNFSQPAIVLVETKDNNNDVYSTLFPVTSEASGSNQVAIAGQPKFTHTNATEVTLGSDSNKLRAVDLFGVYTERATSGQDTVTATIPSEQVQAQIAVLALGSTATVGTGATGSTVKQAVPVKTAVAKLDTEVTSADKTTKNLILVGGPVVNSLVKELATSSKTWDTATYVSEGAGTAIVQLVADAFTSGKSALVVSGHSAADTRSVTSVLQNFDAYKTQFTGKNLVVWKNNVISSSSA